MDQIILRTLVIQFDGWVVEVFQPSTSEAHRQHVALMDEPKIGKPNGKGRTAVSLASHAFGVDADELDRLRPLLDKITAAVRAARAEPRLRGGAG